MPTRAWCMECSTYAVLSPDGICPAGHPRSSLRGLEEVPIGYVPPPPRRAQVPPVQSVPPAIDRPGESLPYAESTYDASRANGGAYNAASDDIDPLLKFKLERENTRVYHDVPWYETWPGIVIVFFLIWPLGMYLLWRSAVPTRKQKWAVTAGVAALIMFNLIRFMMGILAAMSSVPPMPLR